MNILTEISKKIKTSRTLFIICLVLIISNAGILAYNTQDHQWHPLGAYNIQQVLTPIVKTNQTVSIVGSKCNDSKESVNVIAKIDYIDIDAPTVVFKNPPNFNAVRAPGCIVKQYDNVLPSDLVIYINSTHVAQRFYLQGIEIPVRNGHNGESKRWISESFIVKPLVP